MKIKKAYNSFMGFFLLAGIASPFMMLFIGELEIGVLIFMLAVGALITWRIKCNSPKGFFWKNWLSCLWTGFKVYCKIALLLFIVTIPVSLRIATECYYTGYDSMGNEIWLKHIENDIYEDVKGNRYKMN
ncbi:MAG: hypothetical protein J6B74_03990 [Ruminococcus sp.]|nr:hypothetical protein [Ruminococcus sp.]